MLLLFLATLVSEDLACVSAGVLVSQHQIGFLSAVVACFSGIFTGDAMAFFAGRVGAVWLKGRIDPQKAASARNWLTRRGLMAVFISRFTPGLRVATYFSAGALRIKPGPFGLALAAATAVWVPLIIWLTRVLGDKFLRETLRHAPTVVLQLALVAGCFFASRELFRRVASFRVRRRIYGWWMRKVRWEFWPVWAAYIPVVIYVLWLAVKHRSLTVFAQANPGIPGGGFVGESKSEILRALGGATECVARFAVIHDSRAALEFMKANDLTFPVVLKPDRGQRGTGVAITRSEEQMAAYLAGAGSTIIQEYVAGPEFGVFYYRSPDEERGQILSITEKRLPEITGNGRDTLEHLILADERAVCLAGRYLANCTGRLDEVLAPGARVQLAELGSHCRGAIFLDGARHLTPRLEARIDEISRGFKGFYFGRYDVRASSIEEFKEGRFKILELNGVTAEAAHIYDPEVSVWQAYISLCGQWRLAFDIGQANMSAGRGRTSSPFSGRVAAETETR